MRLVVRVLSGMQPRTLAFNMCLAKTNVLHGHYQDFGLEAASELILMHLSVKLSPDDS